MHICHYNGLSFLSLFDICYDMPVGWILAKPRLVLPQTRHFIQIKNLHLISQSVKKCFSFFLLDPVTKLAANLANFGEFRIMQWKDISWDIKKRPTDKLDVNISPPPKKNRKARPVLFGALSSLPLSGWLRMAYQSMVWGSTITVYLVVLRIENLAFIWLIDSCHYTILAPFLYRKKLQAFY